MFIASLSFILLIIFVVFWFFGVKWATLTLLFKYFSVYLFWTLLDKSLQADLLYCRTHVSLITRNTNRTISISLCTFICLPVNFDRSCCSLSQFCSCAYNQSIYAFAVIISNITCSDLCVIIAESLTSFDNHVSCLSIVTKA